MHERNAVGHHVRNASLHVVSEWLVYALVTNRKWEKTCEYTEFRTHNTLGVAVWQNSPSFGKE